MQYDPGHFSVYIGQSNVSENNINETNKQTNKQTNIHTNIIKKQTMGAFFMNVTATRTIIFCIYNDSPNILNYHNDDDDKIMILLLLLLLPIL